MRPRVLARLLAGAIVFLVCVASLDSPLRPSATRRLQMLAIAPQSWGFFSAPRDDQFEVFRRRNGAWERGDTPLAGVANRFGLRRATTSHSAEFRTLTEQVGTRWGTSILGPEQLPDTGADALELRNLARQPQLCGEVLVLSRPPVPWAWAGSSAKLALPARFARLMIRC